MPSFGEGFAEGLSGQIAQSSKLKQQGMLEMAMLSKKIELEQQSRQQEMEQQHQYSILPGSEGAAALSTLGVPNDKLDILKQGFPNGMPEGVLRDLTSSLGMQAKANAMMNKPVHIVSKPDHNNQVVAGFQEPLTGNWIGQPQITLDPHAQQEVEKVDTMTTNAQNMIGGILQRAQQVLPSAPTGVPINKLENYWNQKGMPTNPNLKAFTDSLGALSAQYIKDTTDMAPRSIELMHLDTAAFPSLSDDVQSATQKAQIIQQTMSNKAATAHTIYDPTNFLQSPLHPKSQGQQVGVQAADANQLHTTSKGTKYSVSK